MNEKNNSHKQFQGRLAVAFGIVAVFAAIVALVMVLNADGDAPAPDMSAQLPKVQPDKVELDMSVLQAAIDTAYGKAGDPLFNAKGRWELLRVSLDMFRAMSTDRMPDKDSPVDDREAVFYAIGAKEADFECKSSPVKQIYSFGEPVSLEICFINAPDGIRLYSIETYVDSFTVRGVGVNSSMQEYLSHYGPAGLIADIGNTTEKYKANHLNCGVGITLDGPYILATGGDAKITSLRIFDNSTKLP